MQDRRRSRLPSKQDESVRDTEKMSTKERQNRIGLLVRWAKESLLPNYIDVILARASGDYFGVTIIVGPHGLRFVNRGSSIIYQIKKEAQKRWMVSDNTARDYADIVLDSIGHDILKYAEEKYPHAVNYRVPGRFKK